MRNPLLAFNAAAAVLFAAFFAYTFVGRAHLDRVARGFAAEKTREHADVLVGAAAALLKDRNVWRLLRDDLVTAAEEEIAAYRRGPRRYVADLVRKPAAPPGPGLARLLGWKEGVRTFFEETLSRLVRDLRLFSGSNAVAAAVAAWLAWNAKPQGRTLVLSGLILILLGYQSYYYVDSLSFFRILFGLQPGWWYPISLGVGIGCLAWGVGRPRVADGEDGCRAPFGRG